MTDNAKRKLAMEILEVRLCLDADPPEFYPTALINTLGGTLEIRGDDGDADDYYIIVDKNQLIVKQGGVDGVRRPARFPEEGPFVDADKIKMLIINTRGGVDKINLTGLAGGPLKILHTIEVNGGDDGDIIHMASIKGILNTANGDDGIDEITGGEEVDVINGGIGND